MAKYVQLPDKTKVSTIGQGTWFLGERRQDFERETEALRKGIEAGMTLIDTAEMYGDGKAEKLIGHVLDGMERENLFLVSKVYPHHADRKKIFKSCENSLRRLKTDYLDLYLLHWRGAVPLEETVACMEQLVQEGKICRWGVSNFDIDDMKELWSVPNGDHCAVNQVLYHIGSRGIEYDLLPWMEEHQVPVMAYCPLAQGGSLKRTLYQNQVLHEIANAHKATISQVLLAFVIRNGNVIAIPRTGKAEHALENAKALEISLTKEECSKINQEYPAPTQKVALDIV